MNAEEIAEVVLPVVVGEGGALYDALIVVSEQKGVVPFLYAPPGEGDEDPFVGDKAVLTLHELGQQYPYSPYVVMARCGHSAPESDEDESLPTIHVSYMHRDGTASASIVRFHEEEVEVLQGVAIGPNPLWHFFRGAYVA